jgi:uncharacterized protein YfdQ (DUF2303 family)
MKNKINSEVGAHVVTIPNLISVKTSEKFSQNRYEACALEDYAKVVVLVFLRR